jgi:hypothetical protein
MSTPVLTPMSTPVLTPMSTPISTPVKIDIIDDYTQGTSILIPTEDGPVESSRPKTYVDVSLDVGPGIVAMVIGVPLAQPAIEQIFNWAINRCTRCGRRGHTIFRCCARTRSDGTRL